MPHFTTHGPSPHVQREKTKPRKHSPAPQVVRSRVVNNMIGPIRGTHSNKLSCEEVATDAQTTYVFAESGGVQTRFDSDPGTVLPTKITRKVIGLLSARQQACASSQAIPIVQQA